MYIVKQKSGRNRKIFIRCKRGDFWTLRGDELGLRPT